MTSLFLPSNILSFAEKPFLMSLYALWLISLKFFMFRACRTRNKWHDNNCTEVILYLGSIIYFFPFYSSLQPRNSDGVGSLPAFVSQNNPVMLQAERQWQAQDHQWRLKQGFEPDLPHLSQTLQSLHHPGS